MNQQVHHITKNGGTISAILKTHFRLSPDRIANLIGLGAIYQDKVRLATDAQIKKGAHLLIHLNPNRFAVSGIDWKQCALWEEDDFMVVNKPGGIPSQATEDNGSENVLEQMRLAMTTTQTTNHGVNLHLTHRLDTPVSGLMLLAKTRRFQEGFNFLLREGLVKKTYLALTRTAPPIGTFTHYMLDKPTRKKRVLSERVAKSLECRLEISQVTPFTGVGEGGYFEVTVQPLSGRTHQIRAQLSALGCPILGDSLYEYRGPRFTWGPRREIGLFSQRLEFVIPGAAKPRQFSAAPPWRDAALSLVEVEKKGVPDVC